MEFNFSLKTGKNKEYEKQKSSNFYSLEQVANFINSNKSTFVID